MSVEQRPDKFTPEQYQIPTHAPENQERVDDFSNRNESWFKRYRKALIAAGAVATAGATLAAGLAFGPKGNSGEKDASSPNEGQRPVATAPANPGEVTPSTPAGETAPAYNPNDYHTWTADHVPLEVNAEGSVENFDSVAEYRDSLLIPGMTLDQLMANPEKYGDQLLAVINEYMASVSNKTVLDKFDDYPAPDVNSHGGAPGVLDTYLKPGFEEAVVGSPENGASGLATENTQEWLDKLNELAHEHLHRWSRSDGKYEMAWKNDPDAQTPVGYNLVNTEAGQIHIYMNVLLDDNFDETDLGSITNADGSQNESLRSSQLWNMEVQQQTVDGKPALRIISMFAEEK